MDRSGAWERRKNLWNFNAFWKDCFERKKKKSKPILRLRKKKKNLPPIYWHYILHFYIKEKGAKAIKLQTLFEFLG